MAQTMPWEEYQSTPAGGGQGVIIPAAPEKPREAPAGYQETPDGLTPITGGPADPAVIAAQAAARKGGEGKTATEIELQAKGEAAAKRADTIRSIMGRVEDLYKADIAGQPASRLGGLTEYIGSLPKNDRFNAASNAMLPLIRPLVAQSAKEGDSDKEMQVFMAYIPQSSDSDIAIEEKLNMLKTLIGGMVDGKVPSQVTAEVFNAMGQSQGKPFTYDGVTYQQGQSGGTPPPAAPTEPGLLDQLGQGVSQGLGSLAEVDGQQLALTAGENFSTEQDKAIAAAVNQALANGGGVQELAAAAQATGGQISPDDIANFQAAVEARAQGRAVSFNPQKTGKRNPIAQAAGEALMTPAGTALTGAVNAAGLGTLSQFAGDQVQGLEALNPKSALLGEVAGSMLGTAGLAKGTSMALGAVAPNLAARVAGGGLAGTVAREALTEGAYGGIYAGNTGEDIGTGLTLGAVGSLGGQAVSAGVRRAAPVVGGAVNRLMGRGDAPTMGAAPDVTPQGAQPAPTAIDDTFTPTTTTFRGGGAEGTSLTTQRINQAEGLPVPVELTSGAATRDAEQLAFEKEQLYSALGGPLRKRAEENNLQVLENFDRFIDQTGATATENIADSGNAVIKALSNGYQAAKNKVNVAYKRAEASEGAQEPVSYAELKAFIDGQDEATKEISPVLKSVAQQLAKNDPDGTGQITVATMENIRKLISKNAQQGTPSSVYGGEMKGIIDSLTEGKGGELYNKARKLRIEQARKFENRAIVARLVTNVKNMDDPKVAADEVFKKSIMNESPEDIKFLRQTLRTLGPEGRQAWSELQGATVRDIAKKATANSRMTADNQPVISAAGLDKAIKALDENGRIDTIFNPKMARQLRDLRDVVLYVNTVPPGTSINSSGTARTLAAMMGEMAVTGGASAYLFDSAVPVPIVTGLKMMMKASKDNEIKRKIARSLIPPEQN